MFHKVVATYSRCGGIFDMYVTANLPGNLRVKKFLKSVKNWQNYGYESVATFFLPHPVVLTDEARGQTFSKQTDRTTGKLYQAYT